MLLQGGKRLIDQGLFRFTRRFPVEGGRTSYLSFYVKANQTAMVHSPRVLITGATGAVGPLVVKAFHDKGYSIRTFSITPPPPVDMWPDDVETRIGDITDFPAVQEAVRGVESVVHLAAMLHIINPPPALQKEYDRVNVGGTKMVVDAAIRSGVRRVVFFSTIGVYGPSSGRVLTEDTIPCPDTFYARTKCQAEEIVLDAKKADGEPLGVVLRLGAVYGAFVKGNYSRLLKALAGGYFVPVGSGCNRRTLIYDKDVAGAAVLASEHPSAAGKIFNVSDGKFHTVTDIISAICEALDRPAPALSLPSRPIRIITGIAEDVARLVGCQLPIGRATIDKFTEDVAVMGSRIQRELGFVPRFDLKDGWKDAVRYMRREGTL